MGRVCETPVPKGAARSCFVSLFPFPFYLPSAYALSALSGVRFSTGMGPEKLSSCELNGQLAVVKVAWMTPHPQCIAVVVLSRAPNHLSSF